MLKEAIDALNTQGIFWFVGYDSHGNKLCKQLQDEGFDCYFEPVGPEFENVIYLHSKFSNDQVIEIAERRFEAKASNLPVPDF
ncbi:hypothetical protein [Enterobacter cloacae complex sp. YD19/O97A5]|uniref:hypothetical protein n=1 Tax=Enterobacter cloacae complex sp. YD19/O97A5 TaxID=3379950 RepID=UPI003B7CBB19